MDPITPSDIELIRAFKLLFVPFLSSITTLIGLIGGLIVWYLKKINITLEGVTITQVQHGEKLNGFDRRLGMIENKVK